MFKNIDIQAIHGASKLGIRPCVLKDLERMVILAGPNGGGKSRLLTLLAGAQVAAGRQMGDAHAARVSLQDQLSYVSRQLSETTGTSARQELTYLVSVLQRQLANPIVWTDSDRVDFTVVLLPPLSGQITGAPENLAVGQLDKWERPIGLQLAEGLQRVTEYLMGVAQALYHIRHPDHIHDEDVIRRHQRATDFCAIVERLMGLSISYHVTNGAVLPLIDGRRFVPGELSVGQGLLLAWIVMLETRLLHERGNGNSASKPGVVLALDEPENHLHPHAAVQIIRQLLDYLGDTGQLWVATHSPTIVAAFAAEASLYHVSGGQIEYASSNPTKVIDGLVGGEAERHMLRDMLDDADRVAFYKFAAECLKRALVVGEAGSHDPQARQLTDVIRVRRASGQKLRILDFAAGKARFAMALAQSLDDDEHAMVDYFAYDDQRFDNFKHIKSRNLALLYPAETDEQVQKRASNQISDFGHDNQVDLVVLCNALHEIDVGRWFSVFREIFGVLSPNGALLVLEDLEIPVGELPNKIGYIVLSLADLRALFGSASNVQPVTAEPQGRCSAVVVSRAALEPLADDASKEAFRLRLNSALKSVKERALGEIRALREESATDYVRGRQHARAAMLLANVELALS